MSVPRAVLDAFGLPEHGHRLRGGEGRSFRHGAAVLKPADDPVEAAWSAQLLAAVEQRGFRLARPLQAHDGRWVVAGWTASEHLDGHSGSAGRWEQLLAAGRAFHAALSGVPRPDFLADRTHRWARADRVAWGEQSVLLPVEADEHWTRLTRLIRPVRDPSQLVHGDLSGNVVFADGVPPAIIDFSPYWRPTSYADAIVVIDSVLWFDADHRLLTRDARSHQFAQMLVRALLFRLIALTEAARDTDPSRLSVLSLFTPVINTLVQLVARSETH